MIDLVLGVIKTIIVIFVFLFGCISVVYTQVVGIVIFATKNDLLQAWISNTKKNFIVLLTGILTFISREPTKITLISPDIPKSRLYSKNGKITFLLPHNTVMFANHQIYTDWVYLWWLTYLSQLSGFVYIILKDSLKKIPLLGYGMKNYNFIFLSRKWDVDQITMGNHLDRIDADGRGKGPSSGNVKDLEGSWPRGVNNEASWPYSLIIFPEGTNLSANTRSKTEAFASKVGKKPFKNVLLPKTTGLRFSLLKLRGSVDEVLDITIGYSGVEQDEYGQDIYKLPKVFLEGKTPENVEFWIRTYKIDEIPLGELDETEEESTISKQKFEDWLFKVWQEKDDLLEKFYKNGTFIDEKNSKLNVADTTLSISIFDFIKVFSVPLISLFIARALYSLFQKFS